MACSFYRMMMLPTRFSAKSLYHYFEDRNGGEWQLFSRLEINMAQYISFFFQIYLGGYISFKSLSFFFCFTIHLALFEKWI
jgi:hypothetical protein